jgi:Arc/MetJ family transcription regulator
VYDCEVRTNIEIDQDLLEQARALAGTDTKRATVEYALQELVRRHERQRIKELFGTVDWEGNLDVSRVDHG